MMDKPGTHRGMVLGRGGVWRPHHKVKRLGNECPTNPTGLHVRTSRRTIGDQPGVIICSWCARAN